MTKTEFLAASLPYDLKVKIICGDGVYDTTNKLTIKNLYEFGISRFKPIIRPLDSLTKECAQSDYNEGKPFTPIVELAKLGQSQIDNDIYTFDKWYNEGDFYITECSGSKRLVFDGNSFWYQNGWGHICVAQNQFQLFQQLLKWHFWLNMPEGEEVILVTDSFNPYK